MRLALRTSITRRSAGAIIVTAFVFFAARRPRSRSLMRLQLARPDNHLLGPDLYNQLFTMHGTTMMFLFAVPVMEGVGVYLVPLMVGTRNIAFPRLNAFGYWIYLIGGLLLYRRLLPEHRSRRRLVRLRAALRPAVLARQARRHLGAADHLHRGLGAGGRRRAHRHHLQACARPACRSTACRCSCGRCW